MFLVHCPTSHPPPSLASRPHLTRDLIICALLSTRQGAAAFNQPLSFDTSRGKSFSTMFHVRPTPPRALPPLAVAALSRAHPEHIWPYLDHTPGPHMSYTTCAPHLSPRKTMCF